MGTIYKWKKYAVNIPDIEWHEVSEANMGISDPYHIKGTKPLLVNDVAVVPGKRPVYTSDGTLQNTWDSSIFVTQASSVILELEPDVFYPCTAGQVLFSPYKPNGRWAIALAKSSQGYWKYSEKNDDTCCYSSDKTTLIKFDTASRHLIDAFTKGAFLEEVTSEARDTYPDDGIAPLVVDPAYDAVCYWYEYAGQEEGIPFPDSGQLEQFENAEGKPVFPLTILEGIFRMSDGKSLASILRSIANGGSGEPGEIALAIPEGGKKGQILGKISDKSYDTGWVDPPANGGGATDFSNLIKLPGGGEMTVGAEFGSAPYQIEVTKDPDSEEFVTKTQMTEAMSGKISSTSVGTVVMLTEAEYTALTTKVADRMYLIKE